MVACHKVGAKEKDQDQEQQVDPERAVLEKSH